MTHYAFSPAQQRQALFWLTLFHITIIAASNYLVQFPFTVTLPNGFEIHSTWGALSFPFIFLATDLTVRIFGRTPARKIIFMVMMPALIVSYIISMLFQNGAWTNWHHIKQFDLFVFRIVIASFAAYVFGQLLDISVFDRLRRLKSWWVAPSVSTFLGNGMDTLLFFSIAFYAGTDSYMAENWVHIAFVDYLFKLVISAALFLPIYGVVLSVLTKKLTHIRTTSEPAPPTVEQQS